MTTLASRRDSSRPAQLGIVGGMGPAAGADFYRLLTANYPASTDQEHPLVRMVADPAIPSRTEAISNGDPTVGPRIRSLIQGLIDGGAHVIAVPCNTAHHFIDEFLPDVLANTGVRLAHIVDATLTAAAEVADAGRVWLLATHGTVTCGLYQRHAKDTALVVRTPPTTVQALVDRCISLVKAGHLGSAGELAGAIADMLAEVEDLPMIAGCTELPLAFQAHDRQLRYISSLHALTQHTIDLLHQPFVSPRVC